MVKLPVGWKNTKCDYAPRHLLKRYESNILISEEWDIKNKRYLKYNMETCMYCGMSKGRLV